jgi:hypothetical protein
MRNAIACSLGGRPAATCPSSLRKSVQSDLKLSGARGHDGGNDENGSSPARVPLGEAQPLAHSPTYIHPHRSGAMRARGCRRRMSRSSVCRNLFSLSHHIPSSHSLTPRRP